MNTPRAGAILYFGAAALVLGTFLASHHRLGLVFPIPWPDEASFLWPALSFAEKTTLVAPELNPDRPVFWMPPVYMIVQGSIFKLTGFSLSWARWLSALYLALAALCVMGMTARLRARFGALLVCAAFLHSPISALAGNTARMETLVLLVTMAGTLLATRSRILALALLSLGPLIHPNGIFAFVGVLAYAVGLRLGLPPPGAAAASRRLRRVELGFVVVAILAWGAYTAHVARHWQAFVTDISFQIQWKTFFQSAEGGPAARLVEPGILVPAALLVGAVVALRGALAPLLPLCFVSGALLVLSVLTHGWLYDLYTAAAYLLVAILVLEAGTTALASRFESRAVRAVLASGLAVGVAAGAFLALTQVGLVTRSIAGTLPFTSSSTRYFTARDREAVARFLEGLDSKTGRVTVQFSPDADALLFHDLRRPALGFMMGTFYDVPPDVHVFHDSIWMPKVFRDVLVMRFLSKKVPVTAEHWQLIHARDETERWVVHRRPPAGR